jgi:hypothetical protein
MDPWSFLGVDLVITTADITGSPSPPLVANGYGKVVSRDADREGATVRMARRVFGEAMRRRNRAIDAAAIAMAVEARP